ncbi:MAG: hypothetical protein AAF721_30885 [Myxococcota bacterium]
MRLQNAACLAVALGATACPSDEPSIVSTATDTDGTTSMGAETTVGVDDASTSAAPDSTTSGMPLDDGTTTFGVDTGTTSPLEDTGASTSTGEPPDETTSGTTTSGETGCEPGVFGSSQFGDACFQ